MFEVTIKVSGRSLTSFVFYNDLLPQLHLSITKDCIINFDFTDLERISPLILPSLTNVGIVIKNFTSTPPLLIFGYKPKLFSYLNAIGWVDIVNSLNAFSFGPDFGGYNASSKLSEACIIWPLDNEFKYYIGDIGVRNYQGESPIEKLESTVGDHLSPVLIEVMAELIENVHEHANLTDGLYGFASFFANKKREFLFSISDIGQGFYNSLLSKYEQGEWTPRIFSIQEFTSQDQQRNFRAIIEAIFLRKIQKGDDRPAVNGLCTIMDDVLSIPGGTMRIHCENTQAIFTSSNYSEFLHKEIDDLLIKKIRDRIIQGKEWALEDQFSPLRVTTAKLQGVHIEIEFPLTEKRSY